MLTCHIVIFARHLSSFLVIWKLIQKSKRLYNQPQSERDMVSGVG